MKKVLLAAVLVAFIGSRRCWSDIQRQCGLCHSAGSAVSYGYASATRTPLHAVPEFHGGATWGSRPERVVRPRSARTSLARSHQDTTGADLEYAPPVKTVRQPNTMLNLHPVITRRARICTPSCGSRRPCRRRIRRCVLPGLDFVGPTTTDVHIYLLFNTCWRASSIAMAGGPDPVLEQPLHERWRHARLRCRPE